MYGRQLQVSTKCYTFLNLMEQLLLQVALYKGSRPYTIDHKCIKYLVYTSAIWKVLQGCLSMDIQI